MVYLADLPGTIEWPSPIRETLQDLFNQVIKASSDFTSVKVEYSSKPPALGVHDLLVYFVASRSGSVLQKGMSASLNLGDTGTTGIGGTLVGSEVYLSGNQSKPIGLGKFAFHELMHNICLLKDGLHSLPDLSLGKEEITPDTKLSEGDIKLLAKNLTKSRVQWTDGYKYKTQKGDPFGDPLA